MDASHHPAPNDARQRVSVLKQRYEELGDTAIRFLGGLIQTQRYHWDHAQRVLGLLAIYSRADVLAALERAASYGAYTAASVERVLASQARPMGLLERLAAESAAQSPDEDDSPAITPRSTSDYQPLLTEEPTDARPIENDPDPNDPDSPREECPF